MAQRVNVYDVAKKAGVSQATVSRVLNNHHYLKEKTKEKVLNAINELGFTRDELARGLAQRKTNTIGLIVGDISNPFYAESTSFIIEQAAILGYDVIVTNTNHKDELLEKAVHSLTGKRVDGMIISSINRQSPKLEELNRSGFPIVFYGSGIKDSNMNYVGVQNELGIELSVEHLVKLGHSKIGYICGPLRFDAMYRRYIGYETALRNFDIPILEEHIYRGEYDFEEIEKFTFKLLNSENPPTGIIAASDQMALAVLSAAAKSKIDVPQDLSVIGFDDTKIASNEYIGLTTISQQKEKMAALTLEALVSLIDSTDTQMNNIQQTIPPELVIRKTTTSAKKRK
ncbi:LacI family DNA-binding transcriptional regulator [Priestia megaterium]|uniref:LacI family DNA-binding transcriptional regulator n=1 Tax=Priestia megaterium TaxID=1404 RepID=UPI00366EC490